MRGYTVVALHNVKNPLNIGSVLRAAAVFDVAAIVTTGARYKKSATDTTKAWRHTPLVQIANAETLHDFIPYNCVPIGVDLIEGAKPLTTFVHPQRAMYIFGPEDGTLGKSVLSWCKEVIYVPTPGPCMNLAAAVHVVLYDRMVKCETNTPGSATDAESMSKQEQDTSNDMLENGVYSMQSVPLGTAAKN